MLHRPVIASLPLCAKTSIVHDRHYEAQLDNRIQAYRLGIVVDVIALLVVCLVGALAFSIGGMLLAGAMVGLAVLGLLALSGVALLFRQARAEVVRK